MITLWCIFSCCKNESTGVYYYDYMNTHATCVLFVLFLLKLLLFYRCRSSENLMIIKEIVFVLLIYTTRQHSLVQQCNQLFYMQ